MGFSDDAKRYVGVKEGSRVHHAIINEYNTIRPLPRGYKAKYTDSWCAIFASVIMKHFKCKKPPYECSANRMFSACKYNGQFSKTPHVNDLIFYSWKRNGIADHVEIVTSISNNTLRCIGGNVNDKVGYRSISRKSLYILGYATIQVEGGNGKLSVNEVAKEVLKGKYGNGNERKQRLEREGYNYKEVQAAVNKLMR